MWAALLAACGLVFAVTGPAARLEPGSLNPWHHYEYLTEGFAHGHTYLSLAPPPELLSWKDPYSPAALPEGRLWDASLYQGKYYLYFGPAPALFLMLPWRALSGAEVALWAIIGLVALTRLLWEIGRQYFPRLSPGRLGLIVLVAVHASWFPVLLRRPAFWELAIVCAIASLWWALFCLWRFHRSGGRAGWAVGFGIALAAAMGSRVIYLPAEAFLLCLLLVRPDPAVARRPWRPALLAATLVGFAGISLLAYNFERFGHWQEFGQSYQLWGVDYRGHRLMNPAYMPFNAWAYFLSLPEFSPYFPFIHPVVPAQLPPVHGGLEEMHGILFAMPVHLCALATAAWIAPRRQRPGMRPLMVTLGGALGALVLLAGVLLCFQGVCSRYAAELCAGLTVLSAVGLMAIYEPGEAGPRPRLPRVLAALAALWTVAYTWLASADFKGYFERESPGVYRAVGHALDYPSLWEARREGIRFGPVVLTMSVPPGVIREGPVTVLASGRPGFSNQLEIDAENRAELTDGVHTTLVLPLAPHRGTFQLHLEAPWLYPPPEHPYWDAVADPTRRRELQSRYALTADDRHAEASWSHGFDAVAFQPAVLGPDPREALPGISSVQPTGDSAGRGGPKP